MFAVTEYSKCYMTFKSACDSQVVNNEHNPKEKEWTDLCRQPTSITWKQMFSFHRGARTHTVNIKSEHQKKNGDWNKKNNNNQIKVKQQQPECCCGRSLHDVCSLVFIALQQLWNIRMDVCRVDLSAHETRSPTYLSLSLINCLILVSPERPLTSISNSQWHIPIECLTLSVLIPLRWRWNTGNFRGEEIN